MATLYRIMTAADWEKAREVGAFHGSAHDQRDGYIHFSAAHQLAETAAKHYAGQIDLVLLYVREEHFAAAPDVLRWEVSRGGDRFPHLYGVLSTTAVHRVESLPLDAAGKHVLPSLEA
jgi:uncharacterized protein (DUF952 family)